MASILHSNGHQNFSGVSPRRGTRESDRSPSGLKAQGSMECKSFERNVPLPSGALLGIVILLCSNAGLANAQSESGLPYACDSNIYCYGDLLQTVQLAHLYNDSKYFVDMPMAYEPEIVQTNFQKLMEDTANNPSKAQVQEFVDNNFLDPGAEFEAWVPDDWTATPSFLPNIADTNYRIFAETLVALWKKLGRKISASVSAAPQKYSQIYVAHPVVVPGGRFREFYYWDSYWTIDGLLLSEMTTTVRGMLENFFDMVREYGLVPNGGRVYYIRRSQPPYLTPMVELYVNATNDMQFVSDNIDVMEQEFNFWMTNRTTEVTVNGTTHKLALYNSRVDGPRPESYREDYEAAQGLSPDQQTQLYIEYKSGAESGWDYSSRWYKNNGTNKGTLKDLAVTHMAPVDLNSLLCYNARLLSGYYRQLGNAAKADELQAVHDDLLKALNNVFWDEEDGIWYDFDVTTLTRRRYFYQSNIHPLWSQSYNADRAEEIVSKVVSYLQREKVLSYVGGVPTSKMNTGEQWDYPNAWAPLQHLMVMALQKHKDLNPDADSISFDLAEKWVRSNWKGYEDTKAMFEKYNVNLVGNPGHGGEYEVQVGFGWTNGVALRFMNQFGDRLSSSVEPPQEQSYDTGAAPVGASPANKAVLFSLAILVPALFDMR